MTEHEDDMLEEEVESFVGEEDDEQVELDLEPEDEVAPTQEGDLAPAKPRRSDRPRVLPHLTQADLILILDEFGRAHYTTDKGRPVCGRLKKEKNRVIPNEACLGVPLANGACRMHGGRAGRPIQHGRYSRALTKWKAAYEAARADEELVDARRDLAALDLVNERLLLRAEESDCPTWRAEVRRTFAALRSAIRGQRHAEVGKLLQGLDELIEQGAGADQLAADLAAHIDRRAGRACKVAELELRKSEKLTVTELAAVLREWLAIVERAVQPEVYVRLLPELRRVAGG